MTVSVTSMNAEVKTGSCGANLTWSLNTEDSTLVISGSGAMYYGKYNNYPSWYSYSSHIAYVSLPDNLTSIGERAFEYCTNLTSLTIPNNVVSIGESAFYYCGLTSIDIPNSVVSIGLTAFKYCSDLASLTIGNNVKSIRGSAFANCSSLTSVEIPNSVTSIRGSAFELCSNLTSVIIPSSVDTIDLGAFYNCGKLSSIINYATSPQSIDSWVFSGVNKSICTLYVPKVSLNAYKSADNWKDFFNILSIEDAPTIIEQVSQKSQTFGRKLLVSNQLLILRGDCTYTITGQEVK